MDDSPPPAQLAILRALYRGEVAAADAKFAAIRAMLPGGDRLITIVTSDHGEHLGERRLLDHQFSVDQVLLHVPLVVHGLPGVVPTAIDAPVELGDIVPSVLTWIGAPRDPELPGRPLPLTAESGSSERELVVAYSDAHRADWPAEAGGALFATIPRVMRGDCGRNDRVYGEMLSFVRYPFKLIRHQRYPSALYDLSWDPGERSDLAQMQPERRRELETVADAYLKRARLWPEDPVEPPPITPEAEAMLRSLGYLEPELEAEPLPREETSPP
ncbi:MAG: sulfatase-like hydrolase/transferase [bacterium]|nr:sulfatase-like hydrolase/transferase [bacterium]